MNIYYRILALIFFLFILSTPASSEIYKWRDSNGNIMYSDTPPTGVDVQKMKFREDKIERPEIKEEKSRSKGNTLTDKKTNRDINVIMYVTSWCGYCRKAREYINSLGANLTEYDIDNDKSKRDEMLSKSGGSKGVPLIDIEGIIIKGYVPNAIKAAVEKKRSL